MKQLTDEQIAKAWASIPDPLALTFKNKPHVQDFAREVIAEFCRINSITGEAQPAEQAKGQEEAAKLAASQEALPAEMSTVLASIDYTTPPAQPAREWVGLTDSDIGALRRKHMPPTPDQKLHFQSSG